MKINKKKKNLKNVNNIYYLIKIAIFSFNNNHNNLMIKHLNITSNKDARINTKFIIYLIKVNLILDKGLVAAG